MGNHIRENISIISIVVVMSEYVNKNGLRSKIIKLKKFSWERGKRKPTKRLNKKQKKESSVINHKIYII